MLLSIITVNYNNAVGLEKTIKSVLEQSFKEFEYIIIDGGSTDGSINIIKKYEDRLAYWVSEKDGGIYHAMNKGIKQASGVYTQFLNSADSYYNNRSLADFFFAQPVADIVYADYAGAERGEVYKMPQQLTFRYFYKQSLNHQATLIKRSLFETVGLYDESIGIISDWDFFLRSIILHNATTQLISLPFILFDFLDSMSNKPENIKTIEENRSSILKNKFPVLLRDMEYIDALEGSTTFKLLKKVTKLRSKLKL